METACLGPRSIPRKAASMIANASQKKRGQLNCCSQNSSLWQSLRIDAAQNSMFKAAECALFAAQPHQIQDLVDVTCRNRTNIISLIKPHESTDQCFRGANVTRRRSGRKAICSRSSAGCGEVLLNLLHDMPVLHADVQEKQVPTRAAKVHCH